MLAVRQLRKKEGFKTLDVSIDFPERGLVFIVGESGSCKSTLLRLAGGLDRPDSGEIILDGRGVKDSSDADFESFLISRVGFVYENQNFISELSVAQNIELALQMQGKPDTPEEVAKVLGSVGLTDAGDYKPSALTAEQQQRIALARELIKDPAAILADEPAGADCADKGRELRAMLKSIAADRLVIVATRDRDFAETYGDRVIELAGGKIIADTGAENAAPSETPANRPAARTDRKEAGKIPVKPHLPLGYAAKIGVSGFNVKPALLIVSFIIAILAFGTLGVAAASLLYDMNSSAARALEGTEYASVILTKKYTVHEKGVHYYRDENSLRHNKYTQDYNYATQINAAEVGKYDDARLGLSFAGVFDLNADDGLQSTNIVNYATDNYATSTTEGLAHDYYSYDKVVGFCDAGEKYLTDNFGADALLVGRYPGCADETAVDEYLYEVFAERGLLAYDPATDEFGKEISFDSPAALLDNYVAVALPGDGTAFLPLKIVGVCRTTPLGTKYDSLREKKNTSPLSDALAESFERAVGGYHNLLYVSDAFYGAYAPTGCGEKIDPGCGRVRNDFGEYRKTASDPQLLFMLPEQLSAYEGDVTYYSFTDGAPMSDFDATGLGRDETLISVAELCSRAENLPVDKENEQLSAALKRLNKGNGTFEGSRYVPVGAEDIRTVIRAINYEQNNWLNNNQHNYCEADRIYYNGGEKYLTIRGVFAFNGNRRCARDIYILGGDFVRDCYYYDYNDGVRETAYLRPAACKYAAIISPLTTARGVLNYVVGLNKPLDNDSFYEVTDNDVYHNAWRMKIISGIIAMLLLPVGLILTLIAALFLLYYIFVSVRDKRREIGILRSFGARGGSIFKIFFAESAIIACVSGFLGCIFALIGCVLINSIFIHSQIGLFLLGFGAPSWLIVMGSALVVGVVCALLPVLTTRKRRAGKKRAR